MSVSSLFHDAISLNAQTKLIPNEKSNKATKLLEQSDCQNIDFVLDTTCSPTTLTPHQLTNTESQNDDFFSLFKIPCRYTEYIDNVTDTVEPCLLSGPIFVHLLLL